jgi:prepilin-type N-terminal cleavage/methylation domain-containing protein
MSNFSRRAFSIVELSIVLVISAIIMTNVIILFTENADDARIKETNRKLDRIEQAFTQYLAEYGGLPCPGNWSDSPFIATFGVANFVVASPFTCNGVGWYANVAQPKLEIGIIPTKTLNIPDEYAFDGWGNRFTYALGNENCNTSGQQYIAGIYPDLANPTYNAINFSTSTCDLLTIKTASAGTTISNASILIMSHGPNGHGAYSYDGSVRINIGGTLSTDEVWNAQLTAAGATQQNIGVFVQKAPILQAGSTYFDDIVRYKTKAQLIQEANVLSNAALYGSELCDVVAGWTSPNTTTICGASADANCAPYMWQFAEQIQKLCL